jgi:predicted dehydrogenase
MKLGIIGSGNIVNTALDALSHISTIKLSAIVVREQSRHRGLELQQQYGIDALFTDYDAALADDSIDTVYIAIPNNLHYDYCKRALLANKHVICEKPFTSTTAELEDLAQLARRKARFLFEAITLIHSPNVTYLQQQLRHIGDIKLVQCNYSQYSSRYPNYLKGEVLPAFDPRYSGGALYDINVYNVHLICLLFGKPNALTYHPNIGFNGIDTSGILIMNYPNFTAICSGAKDSNSPCHATIQGDKGYVKLVGPTNEASQVEYQAISADPILSNHNTFTNRMVAEFLAFAELQHNNDLAACYRLLDHSLMVIDVLTQARTLAGIKFAEDMA